MALLDHVDMRAAPNLAYLRGLGRVLAGAILFGLPLLMTMEMWWLGFYLDRVHLIQFVVVNFLILVALARVSGFEPAIRIGDDVMDAFSAYGVAAIWAFLILWLLGIIDFQQPAAEIAGKVALEAVPSSFGAMLAGKALGSREQDSAQSRRDRATYPGQLFLMVAGALFLGFSVAPTEEMILISFLMSPLHSIALVLMSLIMLHGIVYTVGFKGQEEPMGSPAFWSIFVRFTIPGYAIATIVALYLLWTFGRIDGTQVEQVVGMVAVLAFPAAAGAALARLVV